MALDPVARAARALDLHLAGVSYSGIAEALGYSGKGAAHAAVKRALRAPRCPSQTGRPGGPGSTSGSRVEGPDGDETKTAIVTMIVRLDALRVGLWAKARRGDVEAIDRVLKIDQQRARLVERLALIAPPPAPEPSGLSEFERRLRAREETLGRD